MCRKDEVLGNFCTLLLCLAFFYFSLSLFSHLLSSNPSFFFGILLALPLAIVNLEHVCVCVRHRAQEKQAERGQCGVGSQKTTRTSKCSKRSGEHSPFGHSRAGGGRVCVSVWWGGVGGKTI